MNKDVCQEYSSNVTSLAGCERRRRKTRKSLQPLAQSRPFLQVVFSSSETTYLNLKVALEEKKSGDHQSQGDSSSEDHESVQ